MSAIYQHFRPGEKEFIDQVMEWQQYVEQTYAPKLTDFLDPRQQFILQSIVGSQSDIRCMTSGGSEIAERKRALLFPEYFEPDLGDFQISLLEISYPEKFVALDHRMVLGSLMGLGLKREKFGDIIISGKQIQFIAAMEIDDYLIMQFNQIGKAKVTVQTRPLSEIAVPDETWKELETTVSSLRLDVILSAAFNLPRNKAQLAIQQGKVKVNWEQVEQPSFVCETEDVISVRGFGRCKMMELIGMTKKEKHRIKIGILK